MNNHQILLVGAGGHCRSCIDVIELGRIFKIAGIVDKASEAGSREREVEVLGYPIVGTDDDLPTLRKKFNYALVTVGQIKSPDVRIRLHQRLLELGFELPTIISPLAYVSRHAEIGRGTIVMHHALVNAGAKVGKNCIINSKALVEHDVVIKDHCHIATMSIVNGHSVVGNSSFVGSNSTIIECINIGSKCIVSAGSRIFSNIKDGYKESNSRI